MVTPRQILPFCLKFSYFNINNTCGKLDLLHGIKWRGRLCEYFFFLGLGGKDGDSVVFVVPVGDLRGLWRGEGLALLVSVGYPGAGVGDVAGRPFPWQRGGHHGLGLLLEVVVVLHRGLMWHLRLNRFR